MSSQMTIIDSSKPFDFNRITLSAPKANARGGMVASIKVTDPIKLTQSPLFISTPFLTCWGAQRRLDADSLPTDNYAVSLQFAAENSNYSTPAGDAALKFLEDLEKRIIQLVFEGSEEYFGNSYDDVRFVEPLCTRNLKYPKIKGTRKLDYTKGPTLPVKFPRYNDVWQTEFYNDKGEILYTKSMVKKMAEINAGNTEEDLSMHAPLSFVPKLCELKSLLGSTGVWFVNGKFSIVWYAKQCIVKLPDAMKEGCLLLGIEESDEQQQQSVVVVHDDENELRQLTNQENNGSGNDTGSEGHEDDDGSFDHN